MSKEIQPASDCIFMNSGVYSTRISSSDLKSDNEEVISLYYSKDINELAFLSGSGFSSFENQTSVKSLDKSAKLKISQDFKSSLEAGLMFVDIAQNELNRSIMSFRP